MIYIRYKLIGPKDEDHVIERFRFFYTSDTKNNYYIYLFILPYHDANKKKKVTFISEVIKSHKKLKGGNSW